MKRKLAVLTLAFSVLVSTSGCPATEDTPKQICSPVAVRTDKKDKRQHYVCNEDGTKEKGVREPPPLKGHSK